MNFNRLNAILSRFGLNHALQSTASRPPLRLLDFWVWVGSDVLNNALRGKVAEYIVGQATGSWAESPVRVEWDTVDITTPEGISIEVKSAAYIQSWQQPRPSRISFDIKKKIPWDPKTGEYGATSVRNAAVYVFCLLAHRDDRNINPLELAQWEFYVLSKRTIDTAFGDQKTVALFSASKTTVPCRWTITNSATPFLIRTARAG